MFFRKMRRRVADQVRAMVNGDRIVALDDGANSFGVESRGVGQIRGNGCLAATPEEVIFLMWIPRREIRIRRDRITGVERTRVHLGKTVGRELFRVRFTNDAGGSDSVAWLVRDLPAWEAALAGAEGGRGP